MAKTETFPLLVRVQSVTVKIYRQRAVTNADGYAYVVSWIGPNGRQRKTCADLSAAKAEALLRGNQLAAGLAENMLTRSDVFELREARALVAPTGVPLLSAVAEWVKAREIAGPGVLEAAEAWARRRGNDMTRVRLKDAVEAMIAEKDAANRRGRATYAAKLKPAVKMFGDQFLDTITRRDWTRYLGQFKDPVTRNDLRKRLVTLCRWARRNGHLPEGVVTEIEKTETAREEPRDIGILSPGAYHKILDTFRARWPQHLAAVVLAGLCGLRGDEIQGKRGAREKRQRWEDIHLDRGFMSVTVAKVNTPASRIVHLSEAAVAWLRVCPGPHKGEVTQRNAMLLVRRFCQRAGIAVPENAYRHSWITYRIALTGDKPGTATEAGNSVREIDRRYRVPRPKAEGEAWFSTRPSSEPRVEGDGVEP